MLLVESPQKDCFNYNTFLSYDCTLDVLTVKDTTTTHWLQ